MWKAYAWLLTAFLLSWSYAAELTSVQPPQKNPNNAAWLLWRSQNKRKMEQTAEMLGKSLLTIKCEKQLNKIFSLVTLRAAWYVMTERNLASIRIERGDLTFCKRKSAIFSDRAQPASSALKTNVGSKRESSEVWVKMKPPLPPPTTFFFLWQRWFFL